jgi:nucleoside-diphosphate-sugar epimerase
VFPVNSRYYHNITSNTLGLLEAMVKYDVKTLIYSSTCATYGEPETMPITETTPQVPINPYGKAKKMAEDIILDYSKINPELSVMILRFCLLLSNLSLLCRNPRLVVSRCILNAFLFLNMVMVTSCWTI